MLCEVFRMDIFVHMFQFNMLMGLLSAMSSQIDRERRLKMISEVPDTSALELRYALPYCHILFKYNLISLRYAPSVCLCVRPSTHPPIHPPIHPSIHPSTYPST